MSRSILALVLAACALTASASPVDAAPAAQAKMPFTTRLRPGSAAKEAGISHIIRADRARVAQLKAEAATRAAAHDGSSQSKRATDAQRGSYSIKATNAVVSYTVNVTLSDGLTRDLLIDTGSSNTWVGANRVWNATTCSGDFSISYGSGLVFGRQCYDAIKFAGGPTIKNQSIGAAVYADGFETDGILGVGPVDLTLETTGVYGNISTVTDNLFAQGTIATDALGVYFAPPTSSYVVNGEVTFGGADSAKYTGSLKYTKLTTTSPANMYWGVDQSVTYGKTTILKKTAGIVDTGTTLVYLATDAYNAYVKATGGVYDDVTGLLAITKKQYAALQPLAFAVGSAGTYTLSPNAQIWPRALNTMISGNKSAIYLVVADIGSVSGEGLDFINGYSFLERFYTVYDTTNQRFGIAQTSSTTATSN